MSSDPLLQDLPDAEGGKNWVQTSCAIPCCDLWPEKKDLVHKGTEILASKKLGRPPSSWSTEDFQATLRKLHKATGDLRLALAPGENPSWIAKPSHEEIKEDPESALTRLHRTSKEDRDEFKMAEVLQQRVLKQIERKRQQGRMYVPFGYSLAFTSESGAGGDLRIHKLRDGDQIAPDIAAAIEQEELKAEELASLQASTYLPDPSRMLVDAVGDHELLVRDDQDTQWSVKELRAKEEDYMRVSKKVLEDIKKGLFKPLSEEDEAKKQKKKDFAVKTVMQRIKREKEQSDGEEGEDDESSSSESAEEDDVAIRWLMKEDNEEEEAEQLADATTDPSVDVLGENDVLFPKHEALTFPCASCEDAETRHFVSLSQPFDIKFTVSLAADGGIPKQPPGSPVEGVRPPNIGTRSGQNKGGSADHWQIAKAAKSAMVFISASGKKKKELLGVGSEDLVDGHVGATDSLGSGRSSVVSAYTEQGERIVAPRGLIEDPNQRIVNMRRRGGDREGKVGRHQQNYDGDPSLLVDRSSQEVYYSLQKNTHYTSARTGWGIPAHLWVDSVQARAKADETLDLVQQEVHKLFTESGKQKKILHKKTTLLKQDGANLSGTSKIFKRALSTPEKTLFSSNQRQVLRPSSVISNDSVLGDMKSVPFSDKFLPRPSTQQRQMTLASRGGTPSLGKVKSSADLPQQWANVRRVPRGAKDRAEDFTVIEDPNQGNDVSTLRETAAQSNASAAVFVSKQTSGRLLSPLRDRHSLSQIEKSSSGGALQSLTESRPSTRQTNTPSVAARMNSTTPHPRGASRKDKGGHYTVSPPNTSGFDQQLRPLTSTLGDGGMMEDDDLLDMTTNTGIVPHSLDHTLGGVSSVHVTVVENDTWGDTPDGWPTLAHKDHPASGSQGPHPKSAASTPPPRMGVGMKRVDTTQSIRSTSAKTQLVPISRTPPPLPGKYSSDKVTSTAIKKRNGKDRPLKQKEAQDSTGVGRKDTKSPENSSAEFQKKIQVSQTSQLPALHKERWKQMRKH